MQGVNCDILSKYCTEPMNTRATLPNGKTANKTVGGMFQKEVYKFQSSHIFVQCIELS
jgi:hypothetical protein